MKKVWLILLAVVLAFGLVVGCGGGSGEEGGEESKPFSFEGPFDYVLWGNDKPTLNSADNSITIEASGSTGFYITFASMGYTLNRSDILVLTYEVDITTPAAVFTVKQGSNMADVSESGTSWGRGGGREYVLGNTTLSNYEVGSTLKAGDKPAIVEGTWDAAAKKGTFEVKLSTFGASANAIGFQHNFWCDMGSTSKIAENSEYKFKLVKIENKVDEAPACTCVGSSPHVCSCEEGECECTGCNVCYPPLVGETIFDLADWLEDNDSIGYPFNQAGSPTITVSSSGIALTDRTQDWYALDILFAQLSMDPETIKYQVTVKGTVGAAGTKIKLAMPDRPWGSIVSDTVDSTFELVGIIPQEFNIEDEDGNVTGRQTAVRIQTENAATVDFTITSVIIEAIEEWE